MNANLLKKLCILVIFLSIFSSSLYAPPRDDLAHERDPIGQKVRPLPADDGKAGIKPITQEGMPGAKTISQESMLDLLVEGEGVSKVVVWCIEIALQAPDETAITGLRAKALRIQNKYSNLLTSYEKEAVKGLLFDAPAPIAANTWGVLGDLLCQYQIGRHLSSMICDELAAKCYRKAGNHSPAQNNLAYLLAAGRVKMDGADEEAADLLRKSKHPTAMLQLCHYIEAGKIKPHKKDVQLIMGSKDPEALGHLGVLLMEGRIETDLPKKERDEKAAACFKKSNLPQALSGLGLLYATHRAGQFASLIERYQVAIELIMKYETPRSWFSAGLTFAKLHDKERMELCFHIAALGGLVATPSCGDDQNAFATEELRRDISKARGIVEVAYAKLASIKAARSMKKSTSFSDKDELEHEQKELEQKPTKEVTDNKDPSPADSNNADETQTVKAGQTPRLSRADRAQRKEELRQARNSEKLKKWQERGNNDEAMDSEETAQIIQLFNQNAPLVKREIVFLDNDAPQRGASPEELQAWAKSKGPQAMKALELSEELLKAQFVSRRGFPEKLRGKKYQDLNCWSMRLNEKDRLVYSLEEGVLLIHSYVGHYDD